MLWSIWETPLYQVAQSAAVDSLRLSATYFFLFSYRKVTKTYLRKAGAKKLWSTRMDCRRAFRRGGKTFAPSLLCEIFFILFSQRRRACLSADRPQRKVTRLLLLASRF